MTPEEISNARYEEARALRAVLKRMAARMDSATYIDFSVSLMAELQCQVFSQIEQIGNLQRQQVS